MVVTLAHVNKVTKLYSKFEVAKLKLPDASTYQKSSICSTQRYFVTDFFKHTL
jgi:hypothetical protein